MKEKLTPHIIAVTAFVVFIVLGLACATYYRDYPIPENLKKTYSETVAIPNMPEEELFLKIHLFFIENIENYDLESLISEKGKIVWKFRNVFISYNKDKLEVSQENGQYKINFVPISILAENMEDFKDEFSMMENNWQKLTENLKKTLLSEPLAIDEINTLMQTAYNEYKENNRGKAQINSYKVVINDPYNEEALIIYASCLMESAKYWMGKAKALVEKNINENYNIVTERTINLYNKALAVSNLIPKNPVAVDIAQSCRVGIRQVAQLNLQKQQAETQRQQQEDENFNNLIASMNALSASIAQNQQNQSGGSASGGNTGSQGKVGTSSSASSGSSKNISAARVASMQSEYNNRAKAIEQTKRNWENASTASEKNRLNDSYHSQQRSLRAYREDCNRQGADIRADYWETASLH